ncbi:MAG TPA: hypothetical protein VIH82_02080 [Acidimicrobiia bacterium]
MQHALAFADEDGTEVIVDADEAASLLALTRGLEPATVSACPECRSRVLAAVALADLLEDSPPHPRSSELLELADDAPTLHVYVVDLDTECRHRSWRDPGSVEWRDAVSELLEEPNHPR